MAVELKKLRTMTVEQLAGEVRELREEIWKLRLQRSTGQLQNSHNVRATRHDLARVKTVMQERQGGDA